jgi:hypothetical protein
LLVAALLAEATWLKAMFVGLKGATVVPAVSCIVMTMLPLTSEAGRARLVSDPLTVPLPTSSNDCTQVPPAKTVA